MIYLAIFRVFLSADSPPFSQSLYPSAVHCLVLHPALAVNFVTESLKMFVQPLLHKTLDVCNDIFLLVAPICIDIMFTQTQWNANKTAALVQQSCSYSLHKPTTPGPIVTDGRTSFIYCTCAYLLSAPHKYTLCQHVVNTWHTDVIRVCNGNRVCSVWGRRNSWSKNSGCVSVLFQI